MTEAKRVTLSTISSTVSSSLMTAGSSNSLRFSADFLPQSEKPITGSASSGGKGSTKTIRLNVELFQTDSNKCPEFNYAKLLHVEKKKIKKLKQKTNGFSDPFEDNDDDVARIAKELEKKYGNAYSSGRGKNKRDDVDIGMGYDETDSFIDNTEAYDELIPDEVETIEGGFYINCGALEFKKLHTESYTTKTDEIIKMPNRPKKRLISSSSESSSSSGDDDDGDDSEDDDDDESGEESSVKTSKSKSSASTNDKKSKSVTTINPAKKKALVAENGGVPKKNKEKALNSGLSCSSSSSPKVPADERASDVEKNVKKVEKTTTVKDMLKAQRDNFLKSQTTSSNGEAKGKSSAEDEDDDDSSSDDSEDDDEEDDSDDNTDSNESAIPAPKDKKPTAGAEDQANEKLRTSDTKLPELEPDVLTSLIEFREGAKTNNLIGKKFQFDDKLSENFLKIDDSLLCLDKTQRNMVFAHLEFQLSLPKYYFLRKAKQLRIKEEKLKSKRTFNKLHKAITETMSTVIASYEAEFKRYTELQANPNSEQPPPKMPKKKFPWNTNLRNLLYDVYQVRWTSYPVLRTRKETLEEFITSYMRDKVVGIWPKGWMRYEEIQKEIEKRKTAAKKAKEKKKLSSATTSGQSSPNPNVVNNSLTSLQITNVSSLATTATSTGPPNLISAATPSQPVSYMKQFEEFASRSNANSDTDSVASSSASASLKRKNTDTTRNKPTKSKAAKLNGDQTKAINNHNNRNPPPTISVDLVSSNKRTDHSINHIMSPTEGYVTTSTASSIFSATTAAVSQPSKHSTSTHVIDLDNYTSVGDILQTSKQIQAAVNAAASSSLTTNTTSTVSRRESSGDSEIEIVGVFPAKLQNKKQKTINRSSTPNSNYPNTEKTSTSSSLHHTHHLNNNNNNRKKGGNNNSGLTNLPAMDVNKIVNTLMELGDELQIKPVLTSSAQQRTHSSSSTQISHGSVSHQ